MLIRKIFSKKNCCLKITQIVKKKSLIDDYKIVYHFQAKGDHMRARAGLHNGVQQQRDKNGMLCRVRKILFSYFFTSTFLFLNSFILNVSTTMMIDDCPRGKNGMLCIWRGSFFHQLFVNFSDFHSVTV